MPHTTRRRPTPSLKHQHLTTPDGWTHVFRGTSAQKHAPRPPLLSPTQLPHGVTLANVQETYAKYTRQWRESERCAELVRVLEREVVPGVAEERERIDGSGVRNCVVLGLGSLSGGDGREYSWWQLVALQTVLGVLRRCFCWVGRFALALADVCDYRFLRSRHHRCDGPGPALQQSRRRIPLCSVVHGRERPLRLFFHWPNYVRLHPARRTRGHDKGIGGEGAGAVHWE